jgi:hypothetical protein
MGLTTRFVNTQNFDLIEIYFWTIRLGAVYGLEFCAALKLDQGKVKTAQPFDLASRRRPTDDRILSDSLYLATVLRAISILANFKASTISSSDKM